MEAIGLTNPHQIGSVPDSIQLLDLPKPKPEATEAVVKILASTIHIDDISMAQGSALGRFLGPKSISPQQPFVMGSSYSGVVVTVGSAVTNVQIGDEVIGIPQTKGEHGSWADYRCVEEITVMPKPPTLSHEEAAVLILAGCVAYGMVELSKVRAGDRCLVIGASGGIGTVLIQMLKAQGAHVIAVCSGKNAKFVCSVGADRVIDYTKNHFTDVLQEEDATCNLAFDIIGGKDVERDAYQVLRRNGVFLTVCGPVKYIGERKMSWVKTISMFAYIFRRIVFSRLREPQYKFSEKYPRLVIDDMLAMVVKHNIRMPIEQTVALEEAAMKKALALVTSHRVRGRIAISLQ